MPDPPHAGAGHMGGGEGEGVRARLTDGEIAAREPRAIKHVDVDPAAHRARVAIGGRARARRVGPAAAWACTAGRQEHRRSAGI
jgi:hypothetical protein